MFRTGLKMTTVLPVNSDIDMKRILFVCTGNTCRSPMAEAIFNDKAKTFGIDANAASFGLFAQTGEPISTNAASSLRDIGIDFSHASEQITQEAVENADMIFGISQSHARNLCAMFSECADKIYSFPSDISDPFGLDLEAYKKCRDEISDGIDLIIKHLKDNEKQYYS